MNLFLIYLLKSTASLGVFYLLFRLLMRRDTNFAVNRSMLLALVVASVIVPLVQLPVKVELIPEFSQNKMQLQSISEAGQPTLIEDSVSTNEPIPESNQLNLSLEDVLLYVYLGGVALSFLLFVRSLLMVLRIFRKATVLQMDGYRLFIIDREIPSFAFGRSVVISQHDYELHGSAILTHEQAHIRQKHFYDLFLLELVKIFHWFNPAIYALTADMKEIHEFQADAQTVGSGVDAKQYQLLIIQKGVGPHRFALANSFNHCQVKKRIIMMNKQKTSKAWRWKVATFLPLLALLLMAFGKTGKNVVPKMMLCPRGSFQTQIVGSGNAPVSVSLDSFWMSNEITNREFRAFYDDIKHNPTDSLFWFEISGMSADPTLKPKVRKVSLGDIGKTIITTDIWKDQPEGGLYKDYFLNPKFDEFPVLGVSAQGANFYCLWLKQNEMKQLKNKKQSVSIDFRLPTEVEWEYAAKQSLDQNISKSDNSLHSSKVGRINSWGISNLGGNVAEWTSSNGNKDGNGFKIVRGGSWKTGWSINERKLLVAVSSSNDIGFRIVRSEINSTPKKSSQMQIKKQFAIIIKIAPEIVGKGNGILEITKNGKEKSIDNIPVTGRYTLNLDYFNEYSLTFKYPEHIDKTILVSTEIPKEIWENNSNFSTFPMVVNLMKKTNENVKNEKGKPILKIAYIKELDNFGKVTK